MQIAEILITSGVTGTLLSGVFGLMIQRVNNKLDRNEEESKKRHLEQIEIRVAERELMLAEATISELVVRKMRNEEVNGDLALADESLKAKKEAVQTLTRKLAIEYMEGE